MIDVEKAVPLVGMFAAAYLVGSINTSVLATKLLKLKDPRETGSGNPGATNILRTAGWKVALPVLLFDVGKAAGTVLAAGLVAEPEYVPVFALPVLLGNLYPVFHRFRGGKGVATTVGAVAAIDPVAMLAGGGVFVVAVAALRRVSLGSILMVAAYPGVIWLRDGPEKALLTTGAIAVVILFTHRANVGRLLRGEEPRIGRERKE